MDEQDAFRKGAARDTGRLTMREVAELASVSVGTVSRVVNSNPSVKPAIRARVRSAMEALGYQPNPIAQAMRGGPSMVVGVLVPDVSIPFFSEAVAAVEPVLNEAGYAMILTNSHDDELRERDLLRVFRQRRVDGLIATVSREDDPKLLGLLSELSVPVVVVQRTPGMQVDHVVTDHYAGVYAATRHLLSLGHERIGLMTGTQAALPGRQRGHAFVDAHHEAGVPVDETLMSFIGYSASNAQRVAYATLSSEKPPTAIIAGASQLIGVLRTAKMLKIPVPDGLSLISLGDTDLNELHDPPITTVRWDITRLGETAASILLSRMKGAKANFPQEVVIPAELIIRGSCSQPRTRLKPNAALLSGVAE